MVETLSTIPKPVQRLEPCLLVVEDDPDLAEQLQRWMKKQKASSIHAPSIGKALQILRDLNQTYVKVDGLLVDYRLPDATGCRVILEFQDLFPGVPVALMTGQDDLPLELWLNARGIPLFRKPLDLIKLKAWLACIQVT